MTERIDRRVYKARVRELLETAQVSPRRMAALWLGLKAILSLLNYIGNGTNILYVFLMVLTLMLSVALDAGFVLYCMTVRRGERAEYLTLFDGFSVAGKVILLTLVEWLFVALWSMLFIIPGIIALYRYRFALYNLLENPELGVMDALSMSKRQTYGLKGQIFLLDLSYLGWGLLAALPDLLYRYNIQVQVQGIVGGSLYWNLQDVLNYVNPDVFGIPWMAWEALSAVWALVVSMYYRAHYQCVELAYFDTAKRASGVGLAPDSDDYQTPYDGGNNYPAPYDDGGERYQSAESVDGYDGNDRSGSYDGNEHSGSYDGNDRSGPYGGEP
ncbi:MAG: DUF975 family protein [Oscillibacter sp.]|nr:DUF975 family protein [Oscillibacter sp.]